MKLDELLARQASLQAEEAELEKQIAAARREERQAAIAQVRALMAQHGLTARDLAAAPAKAARSTSKVAAKYRDPATGDTWSGRGLQPRWLKAALAAGRKLSDFAV